MNKIDYPVCMQRKTKCHAYDRGDCRILTDTFFNKPCPFFKTKEDFEWDAEAYKRKKARE